MDGSTIVYNGADDAIATAQLFTVRADGTHRVQLSHDPTASALRPCWSPDGGSVVFTRAAHGPDGLGLLRPCRMDRDGSHVRPLGEASPFENEADWGPRRSSG